jgi:hypothetical protein
MHSGKRALDAARSAGRWKRRLHFHDVVVLGKRVGDRALIKA